MQYTIRRFREDDTFGLMTLFYETIHTVNTRDYTPEQVHAWAPLPPNEMDYDAWAANLRDRYTLVAELTGDVRDAGDRAGLLIGFANLEELKGAGRGGHIDRFFVHREHQGIGVGGALLAALEQDARRRGMTRLRTEASITAQPFFERHDFRTLAEQTVERFGVRLTNFSLEKTLTAAVS